MITLGDIKTEGNTKVLLIGAPGAGKTCLAASFPGPILFLDFDNKVDSAALFYKNNPELLANVEVRQLSTSFIADPIAEFNKIVGNELIPQLKTGMKYKTIVLDSISAFSHLALMHILNTNPGVKGVQTAQGKMTDQTHYGILLREFKRLIPGLLTLPCNIVMCAHVDTYKDVSTGVIIREAAMDGSYSSKLPQAFKEVWYVYRDNKGQRWAQTGADLRFECLRSQIPGLPNPLCIDGGYAELAKYL